MGLDARIDEGTLLHTMQDTIAKAMSGLNGPKAVAECSHGVQDFRAGLEKELQIRIELNAISDYNNSEQSDRADRRAEVML